MKIGSLIKYHRTKTKMTQSQLAAGICSVPHLSKIENNSKEANQETIKLLLDRLNINIQDVEIIEKNVHTLINQLLSNILYYEDELAKNAYEELEQYKEYIPFTRYIHLYELYKLRYIIFIKEYSLIESQLKWLNSQKQNFTQHENYLFSYFSTLDLIVKGKYVEADQNLHKLLNEEANSHVVIGEIYYHLALVKGYLDESSHAIYFGKKALEIFKTQLNFKRILHAHMSLAINYSQSKIFEEALHCYEHLSRNAAMLKDSNLLSQIYHNIGDLRHKMGDFSVALDYFNKALTIFDKKSEHYLLCLFNLAVTEYRLERYNESRVSFLTVNDLSRELGITHFHMYATFYLILLNNEQHKAMKYLEEKVLPYTLKIEEQKEFHFLFSKMLGEYYKNEGIYEKAVQYAY